MLKDQSKLNEFASEAAMLLSASRHTNIVQVNKKKLFFLC